ncbi:hypothetical protein, partial [Eisenbergiella massiliensis]|uniref:hypothetical protein n=1 Tax=Eisenbergiella massiliensis TaxID=1720294 RepID=UPI0023F05259
AYSSASIYGFPLLSFTLTSFCRPPESTYAYPVFYYRCALGRMPARAASSFISRQIRRSIRTFFTASFPDRQIFFISAGNEPGIHAFIDIWRMPRKSNAPLPGSAASQILRCCSGVSDNCQFNTAYLLQSGFIIPEIPLSFL